MFVDCCYCKRASWKIGLESNELPSLNKEFTYFTYLLTYLLTYFNLGRWDNCETILKFCKFLLYLPILEETRSQKIISVGECNATAMQQSVC